MKKSAQKGVAHIFLLIAAVGVLGFILVSSSAEFKDQLFSRLFPKSPSEAATLTGNTFLETFDGGLTNPVPWDGVDFDVTVHRRDAWSNPERYVTMDAHHGGGCEPPLVDPAQPFNASTNPLVTHSVSAYADGVFNCRNHVMTSIWEEGYGLIYLTPNAMVDFSAGEAVIRWDMSTFRSSTRDWVDVWISPFEDHLQLALEAGLPDLNGFPRRAIQFRMDQTLGGTMFTTRVICNFGGGCGGTDTASGGAYESVLTPSPARRDTFEIRISRTHIRFCMLASTVAGGPSREICWADRTIPDLGWDRGVVQFGHHSYTPTKGENLHGGGGGRPDTWHWDNVSISPALPFTIIKADRRWVNRTTSPARVTFPQPAPANSFLRFAGISGINPGMEVSFNQGTTWVKARVQPASSRQGASGGEGDEHFDSYFMPIPTGTTTVDFRGTTWFADGWMAFDISIFSLTEPLPAPPPPSPTPTSTPGLIATPVPTPTPAPTPLPTPTPRPSPTPTSTPAPIATPIPTPTPAPVGTQTITFNDLAIYSTLSEYPRGVINWGKQWFVARPTNQFSTNNLHFNSSTGSSRSFGFITPRKLIRLDMINHGTTASTVTLTCGDQPRRAVTINPGAILTGVATNWTLPCTTVTINSSNGWVTHYDNLVIQ